MKSLMIFIISFNLFSQSDIQKERESEARDFFKGKTDLENPLSIRDPFKPKDIKTTKRKFGKEILKGVMKDGVFTNIGSLEEAKVDDVVIKGVFVGKDRRAIAGVKNAKNTFLIKEGSFIGRGNDKAEVKAILPGGVVVVEKILNVYGQEEYLETIIPVSE